MGSSMRYVHCIPELLCLILNRIRQIHQSNLCKITFHRIIGLYDYPIHNRVFRVQEYCTSENYRSNENLNIISQDLF